MLALQGIFPKETAPKSSALLLSVRLCFFSAAWIHLVITAIRILPIDMSGDKDPKVRAYTHLKWKFITSWFNFINLAYFPLCLYCDWREKHEARDRSHVTLLRWLRDIILTAILLPTIMCADITFWRLYCKDPALITPVALFDYVPSWGQHSLHTVSLVVVILDLILVPRRRPTDLTPRLVLMTAFFTFYNLIIFVNYLNGQSVYLILETLSRFQTVILVTMFYIEFLFYFTLQWLVIDYIWGKRTCEGQKE